MYIYEMINMFVTPSILYIRKRNQRNASTNSEPRGPDRTYISCILLPLDSLLSPITSHHEVLCCLASCWSNIISRDEV